MPSSCCPYLLPFSGALPFEWLEALHPAIDGVHMLADLDKVHEHMLHLDVRVTGCLCNIEPSLIRIIRSLLWCYHCWQGLILIMTFLTYGAKQKCVVSVGQNCQVVDT